VPSLAGLGAFQWRPSDIEDLVAIIDHSTQHHPQPFGLFGFSYGGSYSLLAAADPRVAEKVRFVVSIGAYHDFNDVSAWYVETDAKPAITEQELDDSLYLRLVLAAQHPELLQNPDEESPQVIDLLHRYCTASSPAEKKRFYEAHLSDPDLVRKGHELTDKTILEALSPAGKLSSIRAAVRIIHDKADTVVPASHAPRLEEELQKVSPSINLEMLVTSLLSHVDLGDLFKFGEVRRLLSAMMPIFGR
jgi:pimeloyl-ACP methyl ester carboxylesterase